MRKLGMEDLQTPKPSNLPTFQPSNPQTPKPTMSSRYKILFLGETYRADAITWMNGIKEFGGFELITWELQNSEKNYKKIFRAFEVLFRLRELRNFIVKEKPDLIIAERITSYGFIGCLFHKYAPVIVAQQGITDVYPLKTFSVPLKLMMQRFVFKNATLIHAWGNIMTYSMLKQECKPSKIMVLSKGIDLRKFTFDNQHNSNTIKAIVTRSISDDYRHNTILKAFKILKERNIPFQLTVIGTGNLETSLKQLAHKEGIEQEVTFSGKIDNSILPDYLKSHDVYVSMPVTEGVSASLFEAMATGCYPIVSRLPGTEAWITDLVNGRLIEVDNAAALADALEWYYANKQSLNSVVQKNRALIERLANYEVNMNIISQTYKSLCAE